VKCIELADLHLPIILNICFHEHRELPVTNGLPSGSCDPERKIVHRVEPFVAVDPNLQVLVSKWADHSPGVCVIVNLTIQPADPICLFLWDVANPVSQSRDVS
jgi:hypothetical protein